MSKNHHPDSRAPRDPERRNLLVASAALAALGGNSLASTALQDEGGNNGEPAGNPITPDLIAHAEKLAGIEFTPEERETIADTIAEQIQIFAQRVKAGEMPNSLAPAMVFKPMPAGRTLDRATTDGDPGVIFAEPGKIPGNDRDIAYASIADLATWIRRGELTSERLTRIYLKRIRKSNPKLECMITVTAELALRQAKQADRELAEGHDRGPLHGIPYAAKDIIDTAGIRTTWGAAPFKDRVADRDAWVIEKLQDAGAVMLGKSSVGALAYGDIWFGGRTRNPWNLEQGSSGSSAGSASGTSAGLFAFALGTETYGSIVSPAMRCGTTGLRPTFGRVGRSGVMSLCWSLDKIGPLCRSVDDTALVLSVINGADPYDPSSVQEPFNYDPRQGVEGLRVGWNPAWFEGAPAADRKALDHLKQAGCELVEVELPDLPYSSMLIPLFAEAAAAFESLTRSNQDDELTWQSPEAWPNTFRQSWFIPAVELVQADRVRRQVMNAMADIMENVDALATPAFAANLLLITNATGHPTLCQPTTIDKNAPHGFTLIGRLFDEGTLCRLGHALESRFKAHQQHPEF